MTAVFFAYAGLGLELLILASVLFKALQEKRALSKFVADAKNAEQLKSTAANLPSPLWPVATEFADAATKEDKLDESLTKAIVPSTAILLDSLATMPMPTSPQGKIVPMASKAGRKRSTTEASPPTIKDSVPFSARIGAPLTGASRMAISRFFARSASSIQ